MTERQQQGGMPLLDIRRNLQSSSAITPLLVSRNFPVNLSIVIVSWSIWWWVCSISVRQMLSHDTLLLPSLRHQNTICLQERERERSTHSNSPGEREISTPVLQERERYLTRVLQERDLLTSHPKSDGLQMENIAA